MINNNNRIIESKKQSGRLRVAFSLFILIFSCFITAVGLFLMTISCIKNKPRILNILNIASVTLVLIILALIIPWAIYFLNLRPEELLFIPKWLVIFPSLIAINYIPSQYKTKDKILNQFDEITDWSIEVTKK